MFELKEEEYSALFCSDFPLFMERGFCELNPGTPFMYNWHLELICRELEDCLNGKTKRLIVNLPPRSLKSHCVSIAFPAFALGLNPFLKIICASYGQDLTDKHAADTLRLMKSRFYLRTFQTRLASTRPALKELITTKAGYRMGTSVGGTLTGRGGDILIVDDAAKPEETRSDVQRRNANDWFDHTLLSRLDDKRKGCIIVIMQRLHEDDLVGHLLKSGEWRHISLPAIAERDETYTFRLIDGSLKTVTRLPGEALHPEREPVETLEKIRLHIGTYNFAGQFQQTPAPDGGGIVKLEWFKTYTEAEKPTKFDYIFQSWDTANKASELSDYSVCTTWGVTGKLLYLLHVLRKKLDYPDLKRLIPDHAKEFGASNVLIEDKASGTQLIQEFKREGFHQIASHASPVIEKEIRLRNVSPSIENGFVFLPAEAHWLEDYKHEMAVFPNGTYDDQVDSTSQALDWFRGRDRKRYCLLEYAKGLSNNGPPDPQYATMFMRPRGGPGRGRW